MIPLIPRLHRAGAAGGRFFRPRHLRVLFGDLISAVRFILLPWLKAYRSRNEIRHLAGPAAAHRRRGVVAVVPFYGNFALLRPFLVHHRRLGVSEFVFLDLAPQSGLSDQLAKERNCAVWRPRRGSDLRRAIYWLNYLRWRYATGRWCLSLEPSDLFVFARSETRQIGDLIDYLETERRDHVYALVIEMYGAGPAAEMACQAGAPLPRQMPYFDALGYTTARPGRHRNVVVRGGLQRRTVFLATPRQSPALNRIPLVKWRWFYAYLADTRLMMPRRLNTPHAPWHSSPTACLLRFALLDDEAYLTVAAAAESGIIAGDGGGRYYTALAKLRTRQLRQQATARFTNTADLVAWGLLNPGQWF